MKYHSKNNPITKVAAKRKKLTLNLLNLDFLLKDKTDPSALNKKSPKANILLYYLKPVYIGGYGTLMKNVALLLRSKGHEVLFRITGNMFIEEQFKKTIPSNYVFLNSNLTFVHLSFSSKITFK